MIETQALLWTIAETGETHVEISTMEPTRTEMRQRWHYGWRPQDNPRIVRVWIVEVAEGDVEGVAV